ncbi:8476_t:CDS:2 [Funneliformis geosporum]|uniref:8476_t:CDS:1 n=1 Tax=Funneliformis geosporum TaxID=1117311 RepID=A0A9W4SE97_9GLOM|nr:8476_t:CDS:2 [Funneliformis geosporum]
MDPTFQLSLDALDSIMLDEINNDSCYDELLTSLIISRLNQKKQLAVLLYRLGGKSTIWEICSKFGIAEGTVLLFTSRIIVALKSLKSQTIIWPRDNYRQEVHRGFEEKRGFPNVIGALDGSHMNLFEAPTVVDHCGLFTFYDIGYPASAHDAKNTKMATDLIEISLIMHNLVERLNDVWETSEDTDMHQIQYSIDFNSEISQEIKELGKIKRQNLMDIVL